LRAISTPATFAATSLEIAPRRAIEAAPTRTATTHRRPHRKPLPHEVGQIRELFFA
jgi:hypothetical protein